MYKKVDENIIQQYEVRRVMTEIEAENLKASFAESIEFGILIETFNSYENAQWFIASLKMVKALEDVSGANPNEPNLTVSTPRKIKGALKSLPQNLLIDLKN
jgi:hypothetical protein